MYFGIDLLTEKGFFVANALFLRVKISDTDILACFEFFFSRNTKTILARKPINVILADSIGLLVYWVGPSFPSDLSQAGLNL